MPRVAKPWYRHARGSWYCTIGGKQVKLPVTNPRDFEGAKREADRMRTGAAGKEQEALLDAIRRVLRDELPPILRAVLPDAVTVRPGSVADLVDAYTKHVLGRKSEETRENYGRYLRWLSGHFTYLPADAVRGDEVERLAADEGWSDNTRRLCLAVVQQFLRWCGAKVKLKLPASVSRGAECVVTAAEYEVMLAEARGDFRPALEYLWLTGCRPGEARTLTAEMVSWEHGTITLKHHKTKHKGKQRVVYLSPRAIAVLRGQKEMYTSGPLFRNRHGRAFGRQAFTARFRRLVERTGGRKGLVVYGFRHTLATRLLEAGCSSSDVAALLGHSGTKMLDTVYSHVGANHKRLREVAARAD